VENKDLINPEKWMFMLQEAKFAYAKQLYDGGNYKDAIVAAGEYLSSFPNGINKDEGKAILQNSLSNVMDRMYKEKAYINIVSLYEQNTEFINTGGDENFRDKLRSYTAFALYRLGMPDKSVEMLKKNESKSNPYYLMTSVMLGRIDDVDPNTFTNEMYDFLVQELESERPDEIIGMLKRYTKDRKYATRQIYDISKGVFDDAKREKILLDLYDMVEKNEENRFDGYAEVYLDAGISFYKKNNFENGVKALEQFKLNYSPRDDKRAEGLYYLGKCYFKLDKSEEAVNAYMELLEGVPDSVYASAARSELEEIEWRKNLRK
jgi:tetratricopeptide (TPR) repeat protein